MRLSEAVANMIENPDRKYEDEKGRVIYVNNYSIMRIKLESGEISPIYFNGEYVNSDWREIKPPISFMEYVDNHYNDSFKIKIRGVEREFYDLEEFFEICADEYTGVVLRRVIMNGEIYI